jgi:mannosyltransferase OCH1-like enzyme
MKIPKIFHFIWIGGNPLPEEFKFYKQTWVDLHPGWKIIVWDESNIELPLFNQKEFEEGGIVLKVDLLKLEILYNYGGVFVDFDFEAYKNIEVLIEELDIFSAGEKDGIIGNAIMGAIPEHPIFKKLIEAVSTSINNNKECGPNVKTGPVFMTETLNFNEIYVFGPHLFFPTPPGIASPPGQSKIFPQAYANHHWAGSWIGKEDKTNWEEWVKEKEKWNDKWHKKNKERISFDS